MNIERLRHFYASLIIFNIYRKYKSLSMATCYKKVFICGLLLFFGIFQPHAQDNPVAGKNAIVYSGKDVRFTILGSGLIRMEWDSSGVFNDAKTFLIVNRHLPVPKYKVAKNKGWLTITTSEIVLKYKEHSGKFTGSNLKIIPEVESNVIWHPGVKQRFNLKGTAKGLDHYDGDERDGVGKLILEDGILSKDGWTLLDDSSKLQFDNSDWPWVERKPSNAYQDWYFMWYGKDYKGALYEFTKIAGKVPLPPRYAFGYWWSRYWAYSDNELRSLINRFQDLNIPLDILVIDMDWHNTDSMNVGPDEYGYKKGWTGWSWNKRLFPDPGQFISWLRNSNIRTTLNLHPASGIGPFEIQYAEFAKRIGFDTSAKKNIPYIGSDKKFVTNFLDLLLHPIEKQGVDFWWVDWQQYQQDKHIKELPYLWWINYILFSDMERSRSQRPIVFNRWGGLGNHRYQIGFSGDVIISWNSLNYQPYFTNTASNVLYGYWSHDLGGHKPIKGMTRLDPELQTRWLQYGVFNPIFRTHSAKSSFLNKEIWNFRDDYFKAQYEAILLRYALTPYIYTMARQTYDEGIALCRPMYYEYPEDEHAYIFSRQYMFGNDLLIAPIGAPSKNGRSYVKVWLPQGSNWYEWHTGTLLKGGQILERNFLIDQYPVYVKAGAVVPMYEKGVKNLNSNPDDIRLSVFPGAKGTGILYEDAGDDKEYEKNYAKTKYETSFTNSNTFNITLNPTEGTYKGIKATRNYSINLHGVVMPKQILVNGAEIKYQNPVIKNYNGWRYNGSELCVEVNIPDVNISDKIIVQVNYGDNASIDVNNGLKNKFKKLTAVSEQLKYKMPKLIVPELLGMLESTNLKIEYEPENFNSIIRRFQDQYSFLPQLVKQLEMDQSTSDWFLQYLDLK